MEILHPKNETFSELDERSREIMKKTIAFFESKGKAKLKQEDHEAVWYDDFIQFLKKEKVFATLLTPSENGDNHPEKRWDTYRNTVFSEILGFYGLSFWYTWQVSILGLGPLWMSQNPAIKKRTAEALEAGGIFAFGLSEKEHGADLISSDMKLSPNGDTYLANGDKYYIGNGNKAAIVSTFGKYSDTGNFVFFAVESDKPEYKLKQNVVYSQKYVAEYELNNYPIKKEDIISENRAAWDSALATVAFAKFNLGPASIGLSEHSFYEAINHASNRILFGQPVTNFSHIQLLFTEAYARLVAMRLFAYRAADYMKVASSEDKRYLLYNPMVKLKVTMQGEKVMDLIWDVIAARGFEKDVVFESATRDIRMLPKLEGTAHINMLLVTNFMQNFMFQPKEYSEVPSGKNPSNDSYLFNQGSTTKGQNKIQFHDYQIAYNSFSTPNLDLFKEQIRMFKILLEKYPPSKEQSRDVDFMLGLGELFAGIVYGQLILEEAKNRNLDLDLLDSIFEFLVKDFSKYCTELWIRPSSSPEQANYCSQMIRRTISNKEVFEKNWNRVLSLKDKYQMNP
ncbi:MAG: acyl-CoA dehydrogenase [Leptospiraceae bacterium]|nr:acyl-CoA dehydrogenase [Leptospiraceae bacterium]